MKRGIKTFGWISIGFVSAATIGVSAGVPIGLMSIKNKKNIVFSSENATNLSQEINKICSNTTIHEFATWLENPENKKFIVDIITNVSKMLMI